MSDGGNPKSLAAKFWRMCLYLFGGVILLTLTLELLKQIWWVILIVVLIVLVIIGLRLWYRSKNSLD